MVSVSVPFCVSASCYASQVMRIWLRSYWWAVALLPLCAIVMAVAVDSRWTLVALVLLCLVIPPALLFVYYYHALSPDARMSIVPHTVTRLSDGGLRVDYVPPSSYDKHGKEDTGMSTLSDSSLRHAADFSYPQGTDLSDTSCRQQSVYPQLPSDIVAAEELGKISASGSNLVIRLRRPGIKIMIIPVDRWPLPMAESGC